MESVNCKMNEPASCLVCLFADIPPTPVQRPGTAILRVDGALILLEVSPERA